LLGTVKFTSAPEYGKRTGVALLDIGHTAAHDEMTA
jgi:hypothetical protein